MSDEVRMPRLLAFYREYLDNPDSAIFSGRVSQRYLPATLERLARHEHREIRRAAVLALGFLGEYEANPVLGCAWWTRTAPSASWPKTASGTFQARAGTDDARAAYRDHAAQRGTAIR